MAPLAFNFASLEPQRHAVVVSGEHSNTFPHPFCELILCLALAGVHLMLLCIGDVLACVIAPEYRIMFGVHSF